MSASCLLSNWELSIGVGLFYRPKLTARWVQKYSMVAVTCITCQSHRILNVMNSSVSRYMMLRINGRPAWTEKSICTVWTAGSLNVLNGWKTAGNQRAARRLSKHYRSVRCVLCLTACLKNWCCSCYLWVWEWVKGMLLRRLPEIYTDTRKLGHCFIAGDRGQAAGEVLWTEGFGSSSPVRAAGWWTSWRSSILQAGEFSHPGLPSFESTGKFLNPVPECISKFVHIGHIY